MEDVIDNRFSIEDSFSIQHLYMKGQHNMGQSHQHSYYELFYLLDGERVYYINNKAYTVKKGDLVIIHPKDLHHTKSANVPLYERILIYFKPDFISSLTATDAFPFHHSSMLLRLPLKEHGPINKAIGDIYTECREQKTGFETCVKLNLTLLLINLQRHLLLNNQNPCEQSHPMYEKMTEITSYMSKNFHKEISLESISKKFFISPSYLSRTFKKITGHHFSEYLQQVRIKEAKKYLSETQEKMAIVADKVGFRHLSHFNTTFKKMEGMTPRQYRKAHLDTDTYN